MQEKDKIEIMLKRYSFVRDEILSTFRNQQNTLNWSAVAFGVMLVFVVNLWQISSSFAFIFFILVLPITSIFFLNLYLTEIKRMIRNGSYLYELEIELEQLINASFQENKKSLPWWEHWLRENDEKNQTRQITLGYKSGLAIYLGAVAFSHIIAIFILWSRLNLQMQKILDFFNLISSVSLYIKIIVTIILILFNVVFVSRYYRVVKEFVYIESWKEKFENKRVKGIVNKK